MRERDGSVREREKERRESGRADREGEQRKGRRERGRVAREGEDKEWEGSKSEREEERDERVKETKIDGRGNYRKSGLLELNLWQCLQFRGWSLYEP